MTIKKIFLLLGSLQAIQAAELDYDALLTNADSSSYTAQDIASSSDSKSIANLSATTLSTARFNEYCLSLIRSNAPEADFVKLLFMKPQEKLDATVVPQFHIIMQLLNRAVQEHVKSDVSEGYKALNMSIYSDIFFKVRDSQAHLQPRICYAILREIQNFIEKTIVGICQSTSIETAIQELDEGILLFQERAGTALTSHLKIPKKAVSFVMQMPFTKLLASSNKIILCNLLYGYAKAISFNKEAQDCYNSLYLESVKNRFASQFAQRTIDKHYEQLAVSQTTEDESEKMYLYHVSDNENRKKMALNDLENGNLSSPYITLFLNDVLIQKQIASYEKDLSYMLKLLKDTIVFPGCQRLCSYDCGPTLKAALRVSRMLCNICGHTPELYYEPLRQLILVRDKHIFCGDIKKGTPSGSHVILDDEDAKQEDAELAACLADRTFAFSLGSREFSAKLTSLRVESMQLNSVKQEGIYNPQTEALYTPVEASIRFGCILQLNEKKGRKNNPYELSLDNKDDELREAIIKELKKRHMTNVQIAIVEGEIYITAIQKNRKRMGSTYFPARLNTKEALLPYIEKAVLAGPVACAGGSLKDGRLTFEKDCNCIKALFKVDGQDQSNMLEAYIRQYDEENGIIALVTAFSHFAPITLSSIDSYPERLCHGTTGEPFVRDVHCDAMKRYLKQAAYAGLLIHHNLDRSDTIYKDAERKTWHVGVIDVDIAQFYRNDERSISVKMPMLIQLTSKQYQILQERIKNENLLCVDLSKWKKIPPRFRIISSLVTPKKGDQQSIVQTDSFIKKLDILFAKGREKHLFIKKDSETGKVRIIFAFDVAPHVHTHYPPLSYDRLMLEMTSEYHNALRKNYPQN